MNSTFELRWKADMRAIKEWQADNPGNDLNWPSHDDLCIYLMNKMSQHGLLGELKAED